MDHDQAGYRPYYPPQPLPLTQWDTTRPQYQDISLHAQSQNAQGSYYYAAPQQFPSQPSLEHQQLPHHQSQQQRYGYQGQPHFVTSQQAHYPILQQSQQLQPLFANNPAYYFDPQAAGGTSRVIASPQGWTGNTAAVENPMQAALHPPTSIRSFLSKGGAHGSAPSGRGSNGGPSQHVQQGGIVGDTSTPHHHSATASFSSTGSGMSKLPAKPTFEPAGGATMGAPQTSLAAAGCPAGNASNTRGPDGVAPYGATRSKSETHAKSTSSMGHQLLEKLPPLPPLPKMMARPPRLTSAKTQKPSVEAGEQGGDFPAAADEETSEDGEEKIQLYLSSLLSLLEAYKAREEAMQMRIEALAFRPAETWKVISAEMSASNGTAAVALEGEKEAEKEASSKEEEAVDSLGPAPVLGVRLLRKVRDLQEENEELGNLLSQKLGLEDIDEGAKTGGGFKNKGDHLGADGIGSSSFSSTENSEHIKTQLHETHVLLENLSSALKTSEARAERAERALEAAVQSHSVGILG